MDLFAATGLASSKGEVRRNPQGHYVNQVALSTFPEKICDPDWRC